MDFSDLLNICRFCLNYTENIGRVKLNQEIESKFRELTSCMLIHSPQLSSIICKICLNKLQSCLKTRDEFIKNQDTLIEMYQNSQNTEKPQNSTGLPEAKSSIIDLEVVNVKEEEITLEDCIIQVKDYKPQTQIKSKANLEAVDVKEEIMFEDYKVQEFYSDVADNKFIPLHNSQQTSIPLHEINSGNTRKVSPIKRKRKSKRKLYGRPKKRSSVTITLYIPKEKRRYRCDMCNKGFRWKKRLEEHLKSHLNIKDQSCDQCDLCDKGFRWKKRLEEHLKSHLNIKDQSCDQCDLKFSTRTGMLHHKKRTHEGIKYVNPKNFQCDYCEMRFITKYQLEMHERARHTFEKPFVCDYPECGKAFVVADYLKKHKEVFHKPAQQCNFCSKKVMHLKSHLRRAHDTILNSKIQKHQKKKEIEPISKSKTSLTCNQVESKNDIKLTSKKYTCDICNRALSVKRRLIEHLKTHLNIKDYSCDQCDLKFSTRTGMAKHKKTIHEGIKYVKLLNFKCSYCEKRFCASSPLEEHVRFKHTFEKPFKCDYPNCGMAFVSASYLKKHNTSHGSPQKCQICLKKVLHLKGHLKRVHGTNL